MFEPKTPGIEPPQPAVPVTGVPGGPGFVEPDVHVLDRLHVLYKFRKAMIAVTLLVLVAGVVQTYTTTKEYRAESVVRVEPDTPKIGAAASAQEMIQNYDPEAFMQTELSVINSRDLKLKIVRSLHLDTNQQFLTPAGPQGIDGALTVLRQWAMKPVHSLLASIGHEKTPPPAADAAPPTGTTTPTLASQETPAETTAIGILGGQLDIAPQQTGHLFVIGYSSPSPEMAATIVNSLAREYVTQNLEVKRAKIDEQLKTLNTLLDGANARIAAERVNLIQQVSNANVLDPELVARQVQLAQQDLNEKTRQTTEAEVKAKEMAALDPDKNLNAALTNPEILQTIGIYRQQLQTLNQQRQDLLNSGLNVGHPTIKRLDGQIDDTTSTLKTEVKRQIDAAQKAFQTARAQADSAQRTYDEQRKLQLENTQNGIPYQSLKDRLDADQKTAADLLNQQNELEILAKGVENNVRVVETAPVPQIPFKPNASRNILISLAVGLALSLMLAFGLDYLDDTIKTPEDVTRKLHIPFLGLIPAVRGDRQPVLSGPVPHDFGEAYRALRTSLVFTSGGESTRIITVTSAQPLEGKTTTACNLAMVLAFGGSRVLLVDADMRRPGVHKTLKMNNTVGLSHLLVGQARVREAIQRTSDPNFCVMTAGRTPPNPSELLASERMKQLVANLKQGPFDWVVIDTPPVLAVTDAVILTPLVDGVTFVLGAEMTRRRLAERAVQMLMVSRPRVVGGVLNRVNFDRNKYYYSRYYGYQYKSYYGTGTDAAPGAGASSAKA
jgi:capsular exopolysaccharide synthesis family protein